MKTLTIKNLSLQFDIFNDEDELEATQELIDSINEILYRQIPDCSPLIFTSGINRSDITVENRPEIEE